MSNVTQAIGRRGMLGLTLAAGSLAVAGQSSRAQTASVAPIERLNAALLAAMQNGWFSQRYAMLTPVIQQTFDLDEILAASVGLSWPAVPSGQKAQLQAAFLRYTVASYAANFDHYNGQRFQVLPTVRAVGNGEVVVYSNLIARDGSVTPLNYVMRSGPSGWQAVDVLANGAISRVAVQRSDFRGLLANGGVPALMAALEHKVANLSGGMLA